MIKIKSISVILILSLFSLNGLSQNILFGFKGKKYEIPFVLENNFIIVKVILNNTFPLQFIFDTGAEYSILVKREISDLLRLQYERTFTVYGSDLSVPLFAHLVRNVDFKTARFIANNQSLLVLDEDYFRFEEYGGVNVQGIIGADLFRYFVVSIDYRKKLITLHNPNYFKPPKKAIEFPIEIHRQKPYLQAQTSLGGKDSTDIKLLVDTGASINLLLYPNSDTSLVVPENVINTNIGMGLGGYIEGFLGRVQELDIGPYELEGVITNFQDLGEVKDSTFLNQRNGILGNKILKRFTLSIDYIHQKLYLTPNKDFNDKFKYDKSGLILVASGANLTQFSVLKVLPNSPAAEAGILPGDIITRINWWPTSFYNLEGIINKFSGRVGKRIRLRINRNGKKLKKKLVLKELI